MSLSWDVGQTRAHGRAMTPALCKAGMTTCAYNLSSQEDQEFKTVLDCLVNWKPAWNPGDLSEQINKAESLLCLRDCADVVGGQYDLEGTCYTVFSGGEKGHYCDK